MLFAFDAPFDPEGCYMYIRQTIKVIDSLDISQEQRTKIYKPIAFKYGKAGRSTYGRSTN
ncbi:MAG: hypothetical protein V7L25_24850 [Nostoc sp.]|uniref:hypothetical protein n=1 Tax=Nostoc sp. TaxID=1180 RepID=UPI002FF38C21